MSQKVKKAHIKREHFLAEGSSCREGLWFCKAWGEAADKVVASELAGTHRDWKRPICREGWEGIRRCAKTQATIYELVKAGTSTHSFLELTRIISYSLADPSRPKVTESWARRKSCQCLVFCTGLLIEKMSLCLRPLLQHMARYLVISGSAANAWWHKLWAAYASSCPQPLFFLVFQSLPVNT